MSVSLSSNDEKIYSHDHNKLGVYYITLVDIDEIPFLHFLSYFRCNALKKVNFLCTFSTLSL